MWWDRNSVVSTELRVPTENHQGEGFSAPTPSALAIEYPHLVFIVAGPSNRGRRYGFLDTTDLRRRERNLKGAKRFSELSARPRADQRHNRLTLCENPRDGELRRADLSCRRHRLQCFNETQIALMVFTGEAWEMRAKVAR